jgi:hypothetical protein
VVVPSWISVSQFEVLDNPPGPRRLDIQATAQDGPRSQQDSPSTRYAPRLMSYGQPTDTCVHLVRVTYTFASQAASTQTPLYFSTGYGFPQSPSATCVESTYTATCAGLIPVFVHDNEVTRTKQGSRNKKVKKEEDCGVNDHQEQSQRGSVCLKSLVKAICLSR